MSLLQKNTRKQADVGLGQAIAYFTGLGYSVSIPLTESQRYDLIVDDGETLYRVEVKTTRYRRENRYIAKLSTQGGNQSWGGVVKKFSAADADYVFIVTEYGVRFLIPAELIDGFSEVSLGGKYDEHIV